MKLRSESDQIAVVTGASRGLGLDLAKHLISRNFNVVGLSRTPPPTEIGISYVETDLSEPTSVLAAFNRIKELHGRLDVLINNAAVLQSQYLMIMPMKSIEAMVKTNLMGPIIAAREAMKIMRANRFGRIVNISSMATVLKPPGDSVYAATKAGVEVFSSILAKEGVPYNITSNVLSISAYPTDMFKSLNAAKVGTVIDSLPIPGFAQLHEILPALDLFIENDAKSITGQILRLGGVS